MPTVKVWSVRPEDRGAASVKIQRLVSMAGARAEVQREQDERWAAQYPPRDPAPKAPDTTA